MCSRFSLSMLRAFGFEDFQVLPRDPRPRQVGRDERSSGMAPTEALRQALERAGVAYEVDEGEAPFYGPKIDIKLKDAIGREWQLTTIQFDFNLPERFDLTYVGEDGQEHRPYMVHRALLGSMERFIGVLIEHYAGAFPVWLAPVQAMVIPIADRHVDYARQTAAKLKEAGLRVEVDERRERMNAKIRDAQTAEDPLHAGRRRQRSRERRGGAAPAVRARTRARCRSRRSSTAHTRMWPLGAERAGQRARFRPSLCRRESRAHLRTPRTSRGVWHPAGAWGGGEKPPSD